MARKSSLFDERQCDKCKRSIDGFDYNWNNGLCKSCVLAKTITLFFILAILFSLIGVFIAEINFDYETQKCKSLTSSETEYGFTHTVETNAGYNSNCYYLKNHPLAQISYHIVGLIMGVFIAGAISFTGTVFKHGI